MNEKIVLRILKELGDPDLVDKLANEISLPDLQSLLLEVYKNRAAKINPSKLLEQYKNNKFVCPAQIKPEVQLEFDQLAYSLLPKDFEAIELSPLAPLGSNSVIATVNQNNAITTIRNTEVCADTTNVLALEVAKRKKSSQFEFISSDKNINLCASQRLVRGQVFDAAAAFQHFRIFSLVSAGRDEGSFKFEINSLKTQIEFFLLLIEQTKKINYSPGTVSVVFTAFNDNRQIPLREKLVHDLQNRFPAVSFTLDQDRETGRGYYYEVGFQIFINDNEDNNFLLIDGGFTDWTQKLLNNKKERFLISGMGSERYIFCFQNKETI